MKCKFLILFYSLYFVFAIIQFSNKKKLFLRWKSIGGGGNFPPFALPELRLRAGLYEVSQFLMPCNAGRNVSLVLSVTTTYLIIP
jgi:hypothetical protein